MDGRRLVGLEGNRYATCAICLVDFPEPGRDATTILKAGLNPLGVERPELLEVYGPSPSSAPEPTRKGWPMGVGHPAHTHRLATS